MELGRVTQQLQEAISSQLFGVWVFWIFSCYWEKNLNEEECYYKKRRKIKWGLY